MFDQIKIEYAWLLIDYKLLDNFTNYETFLELLKSPSYACEDLYTYTPELDTLNELLYPLIPVLSNFSRSFRLVFLNVFKACYLELGEMLLLKNAMFNPKTHNFFKKNLCQDIIRFYPIIYQQDSDDFPFTCQIFLDGLKYSELVELRKNHLENIVSTVSALEPKIIQNDYSRLSKSLNDSLYFFVDGFFSIDTWEYQS